MLRLKLRKIQELISFLCFSKTIGKKTYLDDKKIVFASEAQGELKGNLLATYNYIHDNYPEYNMVVHVNADRRNRISNKEKKAIWNDIVTAKYVFLDDFYGITSAMKVRENQELIQLWHACGAFKKFGFSRINTGDHITTVNRGYKKYTKVIATSETIRDNYAEAFSVTRDKVKAWGAPRTDIFFDKTAITEAKEKVLERYPQIKGKKIVLIAPTYRGRKVGDATYDFSKLQLDKISQDLGDDYAIVVKWHPALYNNIRNGLVSNYNQPKSIIDASDYSEFNELMIAADVLITDYSSIVFEWALMDKPIVYFIYDKNEYEGSRGLYYDFGEYVYGPVAETYEELIAAIQADDVEKYQNKKDIFKTKFMSAVDGNSTERIIDNILGK